MVHKVLRVFSDQENENIFFPQVIDKDPEPQYIVGIDPSNQHGE